MNKIIFSHLFDHIFMRHLKKQTKRTNILVAMFVWLLFSSLSICRLVAFFKSPCSVRCFVARKGMKTGEYKVNRNIQNDKNKQFLRGPIALRLAVFTPVYVCVATLGSFVRSFVDCQLVRRGIPKLSKEA